MPPDEDTERGLGNRYSERDASRRPMVFGEEKGKKREVESKPFQRHA